MQRRASIVTLLASWPDADSGAPTEPAEANRHARTVERRWRRGVDA
jgi:hypothetical protein